MLLVFGNGILLIMSLSAEYAGIPLKQRVHHAKLQEMNVHSVLLPFNTIVWGECRHVFHLHCILKWISSSSSKGTCPMDRLEWKTATSD